MNVFLVYVNFNTLLSGGYSTGLGYISSVLKKNGFNVYYFHIQNEHDLISLNISISRYNPSVIGFSFTTNLLPAFIDVIQSVHSITNALLVAGGIHTTLIPETIYDVPELDVIVRGEGEYPMLELCQSICDNGYFDHTIDNTWVRDRKTKDITKNPVRPVILNLDTLPFPDREFQNSSIYQTSIDNETGKRTAHFIFSRGCPFKCTYCCNEAISNVYPNPAKYYRRRSPDKAIQELQATSEKYNFEYIIFDDDTISLNKKWFYEFFNEYKKRFKYPFRCNLRVGTVDEDMIKLLKECGADGIGIGIEHGNEQFRKDILNRNMTNEETIKVFDLCAKYDLAHYDFIMVGLPFETKELYFDTVRLCRITKSYGFMFIFTPYPQTKLGQLCNQLGWLPTTTNFKERCEAILDYPLFPAADIQICQNIFSYLVEHVEIDLDTVNIYHVNTIVNNLKF